MSFRDAGRHFLSRSDSGIDLGIGKKVNVCFWNDFFKNIVPCTWGLDQLESIVFLQFAHKGLKAISLMHLITCNPLIIKYQNDKVYIILKCSTTLSPLTTVQTNRKWERVLTERRMSKGGNGETDRQAELSSSHIHSKCSRLCCIFQPHNPLLCRPGTLTNKASLGQVKVFVYYSLTQNYR